MISKARRHVLAGLIATVGALPLAAQAPSIEGTYVLVSRDLPDGTTVQPPEIQGVMTFTQELRNFNVAWRDGEGNIFSLSLIARYTLTDSEYTETNLYRIFNDEISEGGLMRTLDASTTSGEVTREGERLTIQFPNDEPLAVFEGDTLTATEEGAFVDHWRRVE